MFVLVDFLPFFCEGCKAEFCLEHYQASQHHCEHESLATNKVPNCPICNQPIAKGPGESADEVVSRHIDQNCVIKREKVFTNACSLPGCKKKELMLLLCGDCNLNHCLHHRHPSDHNCRAPKKPNSALMVGDMKQLASKPSINDFARRGLGYLQNVRNAVSTNIGNLGDHGPISSQVLAPIANNRNPTATSTAANRNPTATTTANRNPTATTTTTTNAAATTATAAARLQGDLNEEEALQLAIQQSLNEQAGSSSNSCKIN